MLNALDVFSLSDDCNNNVVVKDNVYSDISAEVIGEVQRLRAFDNTVVDPSKKVFQEAGIGRGDNNQINTVFRSDLRCWLTPDLCKEHKLVQIEQLIKRLIKACLPLKVTHQLNGDYSVQLTLYPGNGTHYVRHLDSFQAPSSSSVTVKKSHRRITMLYYLNPTHDGGQLRVYPSGEYSVDVDPLLNRLVVFRSDLVEHEVLPCYSDRVAISLWASSSLSPSSRSSVPRTVPSSSQSTTLPSPTAGPPPLIVPSHVASDPHHPAHSASIFVSMVNYRDSEGPHTIRELFMRAAHPERIFLGVVFQGDAQGDADCCYVPSGCLTSRGTAFELSSHVRTLTMPHQQARGPCLARHLAMSLWQGEQYFLQIDSHMRFRDHWDTYLIGVLETIKRSSVKGEEGRPVKPILTTYPLGYTLPNNVPNDTRPTVLFPSKFDEDGMLRQTARIIEPVERNCSGTLYVKSPLWASGFSFSDSSLICEVPYNPHLHYLFFGEEISMAVRMFTWDYDFFAPTENVLYHLYSRAHRPTFQEVQPPNKNQLRAESQQSVRRLLGMTEKEKEDNIQTDVRIVDAKYGLGGVRTVQEFEESLGVSFKLRAMDSDRDWNEYINTCNQQGVSTSYRFQTSGSAGDNTIKNIEELFAVSTTSTTDQGGLSSLLKALAGLDRVQEFLNAGT